MQKAADRTPSWRISHNLCDVLLRALSLYRQHPRQLILISAVTVPLGILWHWLNWQFVDSWVAVGLVIPLTFETLYIIPTAALISAVADISLDRAPGVFSSYQAVAGRLTRLVLAVIRVEMTLLLLTMTILGIPVAIYLLVRWFFFPQVIMLEDTRPGQALASSGNLVAGSWWRIFVRLTAVGLLTFAPAAFVVMVLFPAPLAGGVSLGLLPAPFGVSATIVSVIHALTLPFAVGACTILYFDLRQNQRKAPSAL